MLAARVEPKNGPSREEAGTSIFARCFSSERRIFAEHVELPRVVVMTGCEGVVVMAYFGEVSRLELQGEIHQGIGDVSSGFIGEGVFRLWIRRASPHALPPVRCADLGPKRIRSSEAA